jgi:hypothetical protein
MPRPSWRYRPCQPSSAPENTILAVSFRYDGWICQSTRSPSSFAPFNTWQMRLAADRHWLREHSQQNSDSLRLLGFFRKCDWMLLWLRLHGKVHAICKYLSGSNFQVTVASQHSSCLVSSQLHDFTI